MTDGIGAAFRAIRARTAELARPLTAEDCALQSMPDVSPTKWHLAHTTWFFETFVLAEFVRGFEPDPAYRYLFNSYYNAIGERHPRPQRGLISRPGLDEIYRYRERIESEVLDHLERGDLSERALGIVELGTHHEQQHQELILTDVKHVLSHNPLRPAYLDRATRSPKAASARGWARFPGGLISIGHAGDGFHFDNEAPRHRVFLEPFELATRVVTCGEFREFVEDGGYTNPELWLSDGWEAVQREQWTAPLYWERPDGEWSIFTLSGSRTLDDDEPVCHVSYYEADAYARWAGARVPTEAEWEIAAGEAAVDGNLVERGVLHPAPATSGDGLRQLFGDVWEWTGSAYLPYPRFRPAAGAIGEYNGKFMVNQFVLRGGSCATPASHVRATYRNFFPPAARWQFSGIRLAR